MPYGSDPEAKPTRPADAPHGYGAHDVPATPTGSRRDTLRMAPEQEQESEGIDLGGYGGAITRGLAPTATGALIGAGIGSVVPGPGTVAGAGIGALAVGGTDAVVGVYNLLADQLDWPKQASVKQMTDYVLDHFGIKRPETAGQRIVEAASEAGAGAAGITHGASQIAEHLLTRGGTPERVASAVASRPAAQIGSAVTGGAAGQEARELGADPLVAWAVSLGTSAITPRVRATALPGRPTPQASAARAAGYRLHPAEISPEPGAVSQLASGSAGKVKTLQRASLLNQDVTDNLARRDLGIPEGMPLTDDLLERLAQQWGNEYANVTRSVQTSGPIIAVRQSPAQQAGQQTVISPLSPRAPLIRDPQFQTDIDNLIGEIDAIDRRFPRTTRTVEVDAVANDLKGLTAFEPGVGLAKVRQWRYESQMNFRTRDDPQRFALALAQRRAADALEDLIDRQLTATAATHPNAANIIPNMRAAREMIAKIWDVRKALRANHVDAHRIAGLRRINASGSRRRQLTGGLQTIAETAEAFPRDTAMPLGPNEEISVLDTFAATALAVAGGHGKSAALMAMRPTMRHMTLSRPYQWWQTRGGRALGLPPASRRMTRPWGVAGGVLTGQAGEATDPQGDLSPYYDTGTYP